MNPFKSPAFRLAALGLLSLLMLIPLSTVRSLIGERQARALEVESSIAAQWGGAQQFAGAYLQGQVTQSWEQDGHTRVAQKDIVLLPDSLEIEAKLVPELRHRGIFTLPVYRTAMKVRARFDPVELAVLRSQLTPSTPLQLRIGIADARGVQALSELAAGEAKLRFGAVRRGIAELPALGVDVPATLATQEPLEVAYELELAGARSLAWLPLGRTTRVHLEAPWRNPSFDGAFLPVRRDVTDQGFDARWQVLEFNRSFPQTFLLDTVASNEVSASAFGLSLYQPAGLYQQNERSGKYAMLMIALVFCALFLFEALERLALHPIQYGLVGLALALFYLLLLAASEHIGYGRAYALAAAGAVLLVAGYARAVLGSTRRAAILGALQGSAYGVFFLLVKSEDYALLLGAGTLFAALALVMYLTRRTDWSALGKTAAVE